MPDPKLKEAMAEIKAVMRKHDIGGHVALVSETHTEYLYEISPSWSAANLDGNGGLHIRAKRADFKTEEQHRHVLACTMGIFCSIQQLCADASHNMGVSAQEMHKQVPIDFSLGEHEPHRDS